ncbi:hypothetical protein GGR56DRAFT_664627 [Xylariaceae sp. FL0804]|nr:hypothetical protein GGR56DRAFT_664627 [Xylariaceae sp. FL0804]
MQSQGPSRAPARSQRRSRVPLSCDPCRARKLKCNREKPCQNCTARSEEAACHFRGHQNDALPGPRRDGADLMRQRIDHLEDLVKRLVAESRQNPPPADSVHTPESSEPEAGSVPSSGPSDAAEIVGGAGQTVMDGVHSVYLGGADWYAVLQEINELKRAYSEEHDDQINQYAISPPSHTVDGSGLLLNHVRPLDRMEIDASLPPRSETDRLISRFFDHDNFPIDVPPILHYPTFMQEYEEHWRHPCHTNIIWLGLLFSILAITMLADLQYGEPPEYEGRSESLFQLYRMRTAQCLLSGDIAKCLPYTVETLRFNATAELNRKDDNRRGLWIMTGLIIRAAINMGFHRDPSHSPGISPLQAEYRRRVWLTVTIMDDMTSFLGNFPRMSPAVDADTREPLNLHDCELASVGPSPAARPLADATAVTYLIAKGRLFRALGRITDIHNSPHPVSYETILQTDRAVREAYENFPPHMKLATNEGDSTPRKARATFSNISLLGMYLGGVCTLHRKYMAKSRTDRRFKFSRDRCISSALAIIASQPHIEASFYGLSLARQMLTLAAMILLLELELQRRMPGTPEDAPDRDVLLQALEKSCHYWSQVASGSDEASRLYQFLSGMLSSFKAPTAVGLGPAQGTSARMPWEVSGFGSLVSNGGTSLDSASTDLDFDWVCHSSARLPVAATDT